MKVHDVNVFLIIKFYILMIVIQYFFRNLENNSEHTPTLVYGEGDVPGDIPDELAVQQIMDILNLPRNHAVDLLTQYDGSVENVFMNIIN